MNGFFFGGCGCESLRHHSCMFYESHLNYMAQPNEQCVFKSILVTNEVYITTETKKNK